MSLGSFIRRALVFFIIAPAFILIVSSPTQAQVPELHIYISDTIVEDLDKSIIMVFMDNWSDTIAGFELWLMLDTVGVISFEPDHTGDLVDGLVDTAGTLIGGWESVVVHSYTSEKVDAKIVAMADIDPLDGVIRPGVPEGQQGGVLFRLEGTVASVVDTVTEQCASLRILTTPADNFCFTNPQGEQIGLVYRYCMDTSYFVCNQWDPLYPEICLDWTRVPNPPYDSIWIEPDSTPYIDTMYVDTSGQLVGTIWITGTENCLPPHYDCCGRYTGGMVGNANCSADGKITLSDIVSLIDRVYVSKEPLCCEENGNTSGDEAMSLSLADIADMIDHVFISRDPLPHCSGY